MRYYNKKTIAMGLIISMTASVFSGCGKGSNSAESKSTMNKDYVYREKSFSDMGIDVKLESYDEIAVAEQRLYIMGTAEEEQKSVTKVISVNLDGSNQKSFILEGNSYSSDGSEEAPVELYEGATEDGVETAVEESTEDTITEDSVTEETATEELSEKELASSTIAVEEMEPYEEGNYDSTYHYYSHLVPDGKGNVYLISDTYHEANQSGEYSFEEIYAITKYDESGNVLTKMELKPEEEGGYVSVYGMELDGEGNLYLLSNDNHVVIYDDNLQKKDDIVIEKFSYLEKIAYVQGSMMLIGWNENYDKEQFVTVQVSDHSISEPTEFPIAQGNFSVHAGYQDDNGKADFMLTNNTGIYTWNVGEEEPKKCMDYVDSDLNSSYIYKVVPLSSTAFVACYNDSVNWEEVAAVFEKVDPKDVVEKKVLTLACHYLDSNVRGAVVKFNKSNEQYRIQVEDYSIYDTEEVSGVQKMNTDIASGKIPDIFILDNNLPTDSYMEKGLFEDLMPHLQNDPDLNVNDFAENVIDAYSRNGKWYILTPRYNVSTFLTKASYTGGKNGWTLDEVSAILDQNPDASFAEEMTKNRFLELTLQFTGKEYIDWSTGTCKFNSEDFIKVLEFANRFPEEINYDDDDYWNEYYQNYEKYYREDKLLAYYMYLNEFRELNRTEKVYFGEDTSFAGFPTDSGSGAFITASLELAISSKSKEKDAAWTFLKSFLSEEAQSADEYYSFPLSKKSMEEFAMKATEKNYYMDDNGNKVYEDEKYWLGDVELTIEPMSEERVKEVLDYIYSITEAESTNDEINNIIKEEAASYFSGQKTAKDVADVIQSRIQIYVNENM